MGHYIVVECGVPRCVEELPRLTPNRLGVLGRFWEQERAFSATSEYAYEVVSPPTFNWLQILAANLFYNPRETVEGRWVETGPYKKDTMISYVRAGLEEDDDIIQQWFGGKDVIRLLEGADSFEEVVLAVDAICGGHESRGETLAFVERVLGREGDQEDDARQQQDSSP